MYSIENIIYKLIKDKNFHSSLYFLYQTVKTCPPLDAAKNGKLRVLCSLGDDGVATHGDFCRFRCAYGYVMSGSSFRKCITTHQGLQWTGKPTMCNGM